MKSTFKCDDSMVISIPLGRPEDIQEGRLLPENFHCVFKDSYKVFLRGQPKALGAAQFIGGVLVMALGLLTDPHRTPIWTFCLVSCVLFVVSGMASYGAAVSPNMCVAKLSFFLNTTSCLWSVSMIIISVLCAIRDMENSTYIGMTTVILAVEMVIAILTTYWLSMAVCRTHFNTLPIIQLKQEVRI